MQLQLYKKDSPPHNKVALFTQCIISIVS